jgi:hypothetical protein
MRAIMAGREIPVVVKSDRDLPFSENLFARFCISFNGEMKHHCNATIPALACVVLLAWHFHRASELAVVPREETGSHVARCPLISTELSGNK